MRIVSSYRLAISLLFLSTFASAVTRSYQEIGDVYYRDIRNIPSFLSGSNPLHGGIYYQYTGGDPDDMHNSALIEMLGPPTNGIITNTAYVFITTAPFHGAFTYPTILSRAQRSAIIQTALALENRGTPIGYVAHAAYQYLDWTAPGPLTRNNIINMRSDAFVEFAYAENGFPIVRPLGWTIITQPDKFRAWAAAGVVGSLVYTDAGLIPRLQMGRMVTAFAVDPVDNVLDANGNPIFDGGASSMTSVTVDVFDQHSGPGGLQLYDANTGSLLASNYTVFASTEHIYSSSDSGLSNLGSLSDGKYSIRAIDQAANYASLTFIVDTTSGTGSAAPRGGPNSGGGITTTNCPVLTATASGPSGICQLSSTIAPGTGTFSAGTQVAAYVGNTCGVSSGTYTQYTQTCAGVVSTNTIVVSSVPVQITIVGSGGGWSDSASGLIDPLKLNTIGVKFTAIVDSIDCSAFAATAGGRKIPCSQSCPSCAIGFTTTFGVPSPSFGWQVQNTGTIRFSSNAILMSGSLDGAGGTIQFPDAYGLDPGDSISGTVTVPEVNSATYTYTVFGSTLSVSSPYSGVTLSTRSQPTSAELSAQIVRVLRHSGPYFIDIGANGGQVVFASTMSMSFQYPDAATDSSTAKIYYFNGTSWDSSLVTGQSASLSGATVTAVGASTFTGTFAVMYAGQDSSAPVTAFAIQGSSHVFDQTLFVSTDSFIVLTATDPVVNGFASTVSTITYRLDPSLGGGFSIYAASVPVPLGTHVLQYRSYDYAGNVEAIKTATFTVTAGSVLRASSDTLAAGKLLAGFLDYGIQADIQSRAENSWTLIVSSPDASMLLSATNIGAVGVGSKSEATLDISSESISAAVGALGLRSGNSTSTASSEIAFGLGGTVEMAHLLKTQHSTAVYGNSMDFWLWDPVAGSTTAPARLHVVSLQAITSASGGAVHILPVGEADAELEVSNGISEGGGTIRRAAAVTPSSREFKSDIDYLSDREIERGAQDVLALRHASFRYKRRTALGLVADPSQPMREGLIYEDVPDSVKMKGEAVSLDDRVANLEMALKSRLKRLADLEKRLKRLREESR